MKNFKFLALLLIAVIITFGLTLSVQSLIAAYSPPTANPPLSDTSSPIYNQGTNNLPRILKSLGISGNLTVTGDIKDSTTIQKDSNGNVIIQLGN